MSQSQVNLKARYRVTGPKKVTQKYTKCSIDKDLGSLTQTPATREVDLYMVYLPQGHSIRVNRKELERLGYHLKPRIVDMKSGDVVDRGGDPYDFGEEGIPETAGDDLIIQDDEED